MRRASKALMKARKRSRLSRAPSVEFVVTLRGPYLSWKSAALKMAKRVEEKEYPDELVVTFGKDDRDLAVVLFAAAGRDGSEVSMGMVNVR